MKAGNAVHRVKGNMFPPPHANLASNIVRKKRRVAEGAFLTESNPQDAE